MSDFAWDIDGWHEKLLRRSDSIGTVTSAEKGRLAWLDYITEKQLDMNDLLQQNKEDPLLTLATIDHFVGWLKTQHMRGKGKLMPRTIRNRAHAAVSLLRFHGFRISKEDFGAIVILPKAHEIADEAVRLEQLRTLTSSAGPVMRAFIYVLTSLGCRAGEAAALQVNDIDFATFAPVAVVRLRAEVTKTDAARKAFLTDEAADAIKLFIEQQDKTDNELVFFPRGHVYNEANDTKRLRRYYTKLLKKCKLDVKIPNHKYYNLHLHNLGRKYFFSRMIGSLGETATHALMGHKRWWQVYDRRSLDERVAEFKAHMSRLYIQRSASAQSKVQTALATLRVLFPEQNMDKIMQQLAASKGQQWRSLSYKTQYELVKQVIQQKKKQVSK